MFSSSCVFISLIVVGQDKIASGRGRLAVHDDFAGACGGFVEDPVRAHPYGF